jgi:hypothetical protein
LLLRQSCHRTDDELQLRFGDAFGIVVEVELEAGESARRFSLKGSKFTPKQYGFFFNSCAAVDQR